MQEFSTDTLPSAPASWPAYRKTSVTRALRIDGPFRVNTSEGPLECQDGFLAVDARGYPYPIATDEFVLIYESAEPAPGPVVSGGMVAQHTYTAACDGFHEPGQCPHQNNPLP